MKGWRKSSSFKSTSRLSISFLFAIIQLHKLIAEEGDGIIRCVDFIKAMAVVQIEQFNAIWLILEWNSNEVSRIRLTAMMTKSNFPRFVGVLIYCWYKLKINSLFSLFPKNPNKAFGFFATSFVIMDILATSFLFALCYHLLCWPLKIRWMLIRHEIR